MKATFSTIFILDGVPADIMFSLSAIDPVKVVMRITGPR